MRVIIYYRLVFAGKNAASVGNDVYRYSELINDFRLK